MATKQKNLGKVVGQVGGLRVRQTAGVKTRSGSQPGQIAIFAGKRKVDGPFKTKELAMVRAKEIQSIKISL